MDFELSEDHKMIRQMARDFAEKEIKPKVKDLRKKEFPWEHFRKMAELGFAGANIPVEYGGGGLDSLAVAIFTEEMCRVDAAVGLSVGAGLSLGIEPLKNFGTDEQKNFWFPKILSGEAIVAYCQTEPEAGSDVASIKTTGVIENSEIIINGQKQFITNGSVAGLMIVLLKTEPEKKHNGMTLVLVDAKKAKEEGSLTILRDEDKMGLHCSPTTSLAFTNCRVPVSNILGLPGYGFKMAMATLIGSRPMIAAQGVGIGQGALELALDCAITREQFGKKIAEFQLIQAKLAEMKTLVEASRLLTYRAAWLKDKINDVTRSAEYMAEASMAKLFSSQAAKKVVDMALQIHGGSGYMRDYRISDLYQDVRVLEIYEGTSEIQQLIIARSLLRPLGVKV